VSEGSSRRRPLVEWTAAVVLGGTAAAVVYHGWQSLVLGHGYPQKTFLYRAGDRFMDYHNVVNYARHFHPGKMDVVVYSTFMHLLVTLLARLPDATGLGLVVGVFVASVAAVMWCVATRTVRSPLRRLGVVAALTFLPYPVLFAIDRGNLEMVVFVFLAAFFFLYYRRQSGWAWLPLALAIASKYYWATLLVLPLLDRRWRQSALAVAGAVAATILSAVVLGAVSGYGTAGVLGALSRTLQGEAGRQGNLLFYAHHNHSLWGAALIIAGLLDESLRSPPALLYPLYLAGAAAVFVLVVALLSRGEFSDWQKAGMLMLCAVLLPFQDADYVLVQWMLVFALFAAADPPGARSRALAMLFGFTMIPFAYYYLPVHGRIDVGVSTLVYPVVLLATGALILTDPAAARVRRAARALRPR
jgi:hypothetical protein